MVIDIRGTNGSGKSTIARDVIRVFGLTLREGPRYTKPGFPLTVVGNYNQLAGGPDQMWTEDIASVVNEAVDSGHIVLVELANIERKPYRLDAVKIFVLDTPLEECVRRRDARRAESGRKPLGLTKVQQTRYASMPKYIKKWEQMGLNVYPLDHKKASDIIIDVIHDWIQRNDRPRNQK